MKKGLATRGRWFPCVVGQRTVTLHVAREGWWSLKNMIQVKDKYTLGILEMVEYVPIRKG